MYFKKVYAEMLHGTKIAWTEFNHWLWFQWDASSSEILHFVLSVCEREQGRHSGKPVNTVMKI